MSHLSMLRGTRKGGWGSPSMLRGREGGGGCWVPSGSTARPPPSLTSGSCRAGGDRETPSAPPKHGGGTHTTETPHQLPPPSPNTHLTTPTRARGGEAPWRCVCPPPNPLTEPLGDTGWGGASPRTPSLLGDARPWVGSAPVWSFLAPFQFSPHFARSCPISATPAPFWFSPILPVSAPFQLSPISPVPALFGLSPILPVPAYFAHSCLCPLFWFSPVLPVPALFGLNPILPVPACFAHSCPNLSAPALFGLSPILPAPAPIQLLLPQFGSVLPVPALFRLSPILPIFLLLPRFG